MKPRADYIIPECYVDTNLIETLIETGCNHQKGCNQVAKVMKEKFSDRFAVGIIDADKRRPGYLDEFVEICASRHLKAFRHRERPHYMLMVHPAIERLIIDNAEAAAIKLEDYDLAPDLENLKKQTKNVMSSRDVRFKNLFKALKEEGEFKQLKKLLKYLRTNLYASDPEALKPFLEAE